MRAVLLVAVAALAGCSEKLDNPPAPYLKCAREVQDYCGRYMCTTCVEKKVECVSPLVLDSNDKNELICRLRKETDNH